LEQAKLDSLDREASRTPRALENAMALVLLDHPVQYRIAVHPLLALAVALLHPQGGAV
jgi:hypothetical protein